MDAGHEVRLYLREPALLDKRRLRAILDKRAGRVVPLDEASDELHFLHLDHVDPRGAPAQFVIEPASPGPVDDAAGQCWDWPGARDAVARSRAVIRVADRFASSLDRRARLQLIHGVVGSVLEATPVTAIHWLPSDRLVDPASYFELRGDLHRLVGASVNARLFGVEGGGSVIDTLGLGAFGLPDLQVHYRDLDHDRLAAWIYNLAAFLFEKGDLLTNDNSVPGLEPGDDWRCRREWSLVPPRREVVDLHPGNHRPA